MYKLILLMPTRPGCFFASHTMPFKKEVKPLPDNIYNVPENIAAIRKNLFQVNNTITLSLEEYKSIGLMLIMFGHQKVHRIL